MAPLMTVDEYFRTPERIAPAELVHGALRVADAPSVPHQQAVAAFFLELHRHVREQRLGHVLLSPLDVVLDRDGAVILQPDLLFVSAARAHILHHRVAGAPDMVLEVLSPNPRIGSLDERIELFAEYGVREIWLLSHLTQRFQVLRAEGGRIVEETQFTYSQPIRSSVLPRFSAVVGRILEQQP